MDGLTDTAKRMGAKGLVWLKVAADGTFESPVAKFLSATEVATLSERLATQPGDLVLIVADEWATTCEVLGQLRNDLGRPPVSEGPYRYLWVVDFPLFVGIDATTGRPKPGHHPFCQPHPDDLHLLESDPLRVRAQAYDLVLNGWELGSGSIRIHQPELQARVFRLLGISDEEAQRRFGFFLNPFRYGAPPHGGFAFGIDRLVAVLAGEDNIREIIAFPKTQSGSDPMTNAPTPVDTTQLDDLGIRSSRRSPQENPQLIGTDDPQGRWCIIASHGDEHAPTGGLPAPARSGRGARGSAPAGTCRLAHDDRLPGEPRPEPRRPTARGGAGVDRRSRALRRTAVDGLGGGGHRRGRLALPARRDRRPPHPPPTIRCRHAESPAADCRRARWRSPPCRCSSRACGGDPPSAPSPGSAHSFFRAGVVIVVRHPDGERILAFERVDSPGSWQLPQGGLHRDESPIEGAWRELGEETGLGESDVVARAEYPDWIAYEWPDDVKERLGRDGKRLGQVQQVVPVRRPVGRHHAGARRA